MSKFWFYFIEITFFIFFCVVTYMLFTFSESVDPENTANSKAMTALTFLLLVTIYVWNYWHNKWMKNK